MNSKQFEAMLILRERSLEKRTVIKERLLYAEMLKHKEECPSCHAMFEAYMGKLDYQKAGKLASDVLSSIVNNRIH